MAMVPFTAPPGFDELSVEDKLDYLHALWGRIASKPEEIPVPDWHRQILAERLASYRAGEGSSRPWTEFREELRSLLRAPTR
jgi:putative addiction module component (TIGR02574 family)